MDPFTCSRIIDLICLPWSENDSTKFLVDNCNKFKIIRVETLDRIGCTEQELSTKEGGWVSTKNSVDGVLKFIENIYSILGDTDMAKYVSENWDNFFVAKKNAIKKKLHKFFDDYPMKEQSRTMTVIKACDRDCVNITTHQLDQQFISWGALKHSQRHSIFIKVGKTSKEMIQVIHYVESTAKLFTLNWQLIIEFDWNVLNSKIKVNLLMSDVIGWRKDSIDSETIEAITSIVNKFSKQQEVIESPLRVQKKIIELALEQTQELEGSENEDDDQLLYLEESKLVQGSITPENIYKIQSISLPVVVGNGNEPLTTTNPSLLLSNTTRIPSELQGSNIIGNESVSIYSSPFLLPGETIQLIVPNINYSDGLSSSSSSLSNSTGNTEKKSSKSWFGLGSDKKSNSTSINGCLILTNFQIIFVPAERKSLSYTDGLKNKNITVAMMNQTRISIKTAEVTKSQSSPRRGTQTEKLTTGTPVQSKSLSQSVVSATQLKSTTSHRRSASEIKELELPVPKLPIIIHSAPQSPNTGSITPRKRDSLSNLHSYNQTLDLTANSNYSIPSKNNIHNLDEHIYIPYQSIFKIEKNDKKILEIYCKDFRNLFFSFKNSATSISSFLDDMKLYFPNKDIESFAFRFHSPFLKLFCSQILLNGWDIFNLEKELQRILRNDPAWRLTNINKNYEICDSYPTVLAVPTKVTDEMIQIIKDFRSRGRFQVLSWRHPATGASLTRCSQPRVGLRQTRCKEDEKLIHEIMLVNQTQLNAEDKLKPLYLLDARPRANAIANQAVGAGVETTTRYKNIKLSFLNIPNIHVMRDSVRKLHELVLSENTQSSTYYTQLESTHWFEHINLLLVSANKIAKLLNSGLNVLIHCSDGWDRTSQLSSLVMVMLDPYYRTLEGFICLIEKEWLAYGHKFSDRCGHYFYTNNESETSPIFLQLIDCVFQIMQQFPNEFEFNERFLIAVLDHSNSTQFGTFIGNCIRERENLHLKDNTISLWTLIYLHKHDYCSPYYVGYQDPAYMEHIKNECLFSFIKPRTSVKDLRLWTNYYLRYDPLLPLGDLFGERNLWGWDVAEQANESNKLAQLADDYQTQLKAEKLKNILLENKIKELEAKLENK